MSVLVIDTDVASAILRGRVPGPLEARLAGQTLAVTFVTVGELTKWTLVRSWGSHRLAVLNHFLTARVGVLPYNAPVARAWGELQARGQIRGRPRPTNDTWIAACCITSGLPLASLNIKDFIDFAEYDGLQLLRNT
ncbi:MULTISPECIES: type II toxin-antitoxin system VapC family toxin [Protofrankia]|uniref:PilT protein domain protein n=1 Tax=Candidatus Protofrankia datiscae TaxID=2716812 RepID=F8B520_9ACTN|nr:PilT protein domain protein [Candidatus Protofrankia datiscae]